MRIFVSILFPSIFLILSSCDDFLSPSGGNNRNSNVKIEEIPVYGTASTSGTEWVMLADPNGQVVTFDITKYQSIDSIIFKASLRSATDGYHCIAELYDKTNDSPISGSTIYSRVRYTMHTVRSDDLKFSFPNNEIFLGARIKSEKNSNFVEARNFLVLVYYH
jgi:hypothetical protein